MAYKVKNKVNTGFPKAIWTVKDIVKKKLQNKFKFKVEEVDSNPNMPDFEGRHYRVTLTNKETKVRKSFYYSQGYGIKETDDESILFGLVSSLYSDMPYIDYEVFEGLGYKGKEAERVYRNICKNQDKVEALNLKDFLENLTKEEKDTFE